VILPHAVYANRGLEFGAYRQYVENHWDGESDVLFIHDDAEVSDLKAFDDVAALADMGVDHAYIFHDENEEYVNGGAHGRAMWIRGSILKQLASDFPADMDNRGVNVGKTAQKGIFQFHERIMQLSPNTGVIAIIPQFRFAHRGRLHTDMFVYRKTHSPVPGGLVNVL
jgi:DNA-binding FadR family transcriptional regulator